MRIGNICSALWEKYVIAPISTRVADGLMAKVDGITSRVDILEDRFVNYYRNRWNAIDDLADYLVGAKVSGDYLEFGVFKGATFSYACKVMSPLFEEMRFVALDSFEGLPKPKGLDADKGYTSGFYEGQFACSEDEFVSNLKKANVNLEKVMVVKGWFDQMLKPENLKQSKVDVNKVAAVWIDCDLYESTVPVLQFLTTRLSVGSVILFDDWRCFRNLPGFGQQLACREWLDANSQITLHDLFSFGWHGQAFTVGSC
jgi:O-methyltransferase